MHSVKDYFYGRKLVIASKHRKEEVITPLIEHNLGVKTFVATDFDTDLLGTFTGEIERQDDPITTVRNKCLLAMDKHNCDLGIASEGSFGSHPTIFFANCDEEFLIFIDKKNGLEIISRELSAVTNFNGSEIKSENELQDFAKNALFPSHALILRDRKDSQNSITKGITDWPTLFNTYNDLIKKHGTAYAETDMRAMFNPSRMKVIQKATEKLVAKINTLCPKCYTPGFDIGDIKRGLPCSLCRMPTNSTMSYIYSCKKCGHTEEMKYPHKKTKEEPMYCDYCNP